MARALQGVKNVSIWECSSHALRLLPPPESEDRILFNALAFVCGRLGSTYQECVKFCVLYLEKEGTRKADLVERWMKCGLIGRHYEGDEIIQYLVNALLLESLCNKNLVQVRVLIHKELVKLLQTVTNLILLELGGRGLKDVPEDEKWEEADCILLMNNKISKLPKNVSCPKLRMLSCPPHFFQSMPVLQVLDLSYTRIKYLAQSLFKCVPLREVFLKGCELFMELPPDYRLTQEYWEIDKFEMLESINLWE